MKRLLDIGLTRYGAKTYHALLELGQASAGDVARRSGIPRNRVYDTLDELSNEGLVEMVLDEPRVYRPLPVEAWLDRRIQAFENDANRFREQKAEIGKLVSELSPSTPELASAPGSIKLIKGNVANDVLALELVSKAEKTLLAALTTGAALRVLCGDDTRPALEAALERGVEVRVVVVFGDQNSEMLESLQRSTLAPFIRVARHPRFHVARLIQDRKQLYLRQPVGTDMGSRAEVGFLTDKDALVLDAEDYISHLWETGETLEEHASYLETGTPSEWQHVRRDVAAGVEDVVRAVKAAKREIVTMTDDPMGFPAEHAMRITQEVLASVARGVRFRLITRITAENAVLFENMSPEIGEVRHHEHPDLRFQIVDDAHLSETISANEDGTGLMLSSTIQLKIQGFRQYFEERWRMSIPLADRLEQLKHGHEPARVEIHSAHDRQLGVWQKMARQIRESVDSIGPASEYEEHGERQIDAIRERIARGIKYRFVVLGGSLTPKLLRAYCELGIEVRYSDLPHIGGFVLVDKRAALVAPYTVGQGDAPIGRAFLWVSEDESVLRFLTKQFEAFWASATPAPEA